MRTVATAGAVAAAMALQPATSGSIHTIAQQEPRRTAFEPSSASLSADGRYVAFASYARLDARDADERRDIYVFDRATGQVSFESPPSNVLPDNGDRRHPRLSGDGHIVVYERASSSHSDIVVRERLTGRLTVVTQGRQGTTADGFSSNPEISRDGRVVVFSSNATNLVSERDPNGAAEDIYLYDRLSGTLERISGAAFGSSVAPSVSADGRYVAFASTADFSQPAPRGRLPWYEVYALDRNSKGIHVVSRGVARDHPNGGSWSPALSADGRWLAFVSSATNLVAEDRNHSPDVFVADLSTGRIELVSRTPAGEAANGRSAAPAISDDGQVVAFQSEASDMSCGRRCPPASEDINLLWDVFVRDRQKATTRRVSRDTRSEWMEPSGGPAMDASGMVVVFSSRHPIDASDTKNDFDLFICAPRFAGR